MPILSKLRLNKTLASNQVLSARTHSRKVAAAVGSTDGRRSGLEETVWWVRGTGDATEGVAYWLAFPEPTRP
jgi:hypothetical protein